MFSRTLFRLAANRVLPGGRRARLSILIYHRVLEDRDPLFPEEVTEPEFQAQMHWLREHCNVLPLSDAVKRLYAGTLPPRAACVTFDDGYADNEALALPVLRSAGVPATFFIATGYIGGGTMWNDFITETVRRVEEPWFDLRHLGLGAYETSSWDEKRLTVRRLITALRHRCPGERADLAKRIAEHSQTSLPRMLMMNWAQVERLVAEGMELGAHTVTHPILASLELPEARAEIERSRVRLEEVTGKRIGLFAYPNGRPGADYTAAHATLVRDLRFEAAVSTSWGVSTRRESPWELKRFTPWDKTPARFGLRLLMNGLRGGRRNAHWDAR